ncbi:MAG: hypothetical protein KDK78_08000 [Chlamydiia bacterium]|nr:hypothetical protein [Chlamydiia bacterium]
MDFTREPIIETVITPREGCKLVLRNSKNGSQEEYFVDAVEVVSFGSGFFFRSLERPKAFLVPVSDYELLEVRETRMVLKNVGVDRSIKIGGGRESSRSNREPSSSKAAPAAPAPVEAAEGKEEGRTEKKRDRRRHARRRRGREERAEAKAAEGQEEVDLPSCEAPQLKGRDKDTPEKGSKSKKATQPPAVDSEPTDNGELSLEEQLGFSSPMFSTLLPPPPRLISETISQYREREEYKGAFFQEKEEEVATEAEAPVEEAAPLPEPEATSEASTEGTDTLEEVTNGNQAPA